jgi:DNA helicase-2/ATP-dependent DNA helicase PcrA
MAEAPVLAPPLTPEQRDIVQAGDGSRVVIAGAGTGKTRVIVERVRWLLETKGEAAEGETGRDTEGRLLAAEPRPVAGPTPSPDRDRPFDGPLTPEQILVLTYNVKAARELQARLDDAVGPATRSRMTVSNFHSFCNRVLTESAADAGLPANPEVLDGVGQILLLRDIRPSLELVYHNDWFRPQFVAFINRAKDELVTPADFEAFVDGERRVFEDRYGPYEAAAEKLGQQGNLAAPREVRKAYAAYRRLQRAEDTWEPAADAAPEEAFRPDLAADAEKAFEKAADREARRMVSGDGKARPRNRFDPSLLPQIDTLAATYEKDGAALEVMRLTELAAVYRAYQTELVRRGALDFGEQIAAVTQLFKIRPNVLRRWQRQYRYLLVDEFQDANVAQIELVELLGRTPDRPDNVMVVGDDDQSIYRFRGASFAAFSEFDARFSRPPIHDPTAPPPGPPPRLRLEQNFRSTGRILTSANGLIARNQARYEPDKRLWTDREAGDEVELATCAGPEDEAVAIVDAIRAFVGEGDGDGAKPRWSDVAVLYRKHKHRDAIVARLRDEDIPYTVVGGLSLFEAPEIRDLEQSLRAVANPEDSVALTRMMTAGPWRLDAIEILRVTRTANFDRRPVIDAVRQIVDTGEVEIGEGSESAVLAATRARLRRLLGVLEELTPLTWREGPFTILTRFLERTGQVLDLIAVDTLEAHRSVANIASFLRFASDWQAANPSGTLAGFVAYLDAYREAGGELPTSVELSEDVEGVRLMTLYQAKGLEFRHVIIPGLLDGEWPAREYGAGLFPPELLREAVPVGDIHTDEERRLLYVAMTRAQDRLMLTTQGGPTVEKSASAFVAELRDGDGTALRLVDRTGGSTSPAEAAAGEGVVTTGTTEGAAAAPAAASVAETAEAEPEAIEEDEGPRHLTLDDLFLMAEEPPIPPSQASLDATLTLARRVMPLPTKRERRLSLRLRATELIGMLEGTTTADPEAEEARQAFAEELTGVGRSAAMEADQARAAGLDPLTFRTVALDSGIGANLLQVAPLPGAFSYTQFDSYETCPLRYAFGHVYRIPSPRVVAAFAFGHTAHEAFEAFTRERRERASRGDPPPTREDLERLFRDRWIPTEFGDKTSEEAYARRIDNLLDNFWEGELRTLGQAIHEEQPFSLALEPGDGGPPVIVGGQIDRIDRLPSGGIEVIDYKTGRVSSQKGVDESLQLSIYALACRDALDLGTPETVTLYFTESATRLSTTRTDEQLDTARDDVLARAARIRSGDFAATPSVTACSRCDYAPMCPSRV